MDKKVYIFETPHQLTNFYVKLWTEIAVEAIFEKGRFNAALSGGKTPVEFMCKLSGLDAFDLWRNTYLFQVDERFVGENTDDSNFRLIRNNLLNYVPVPAENVSPIHTDVDNAIVAADKYELALKEHFQTNSNVPTFDLINLGLGADGHCASLYPGSDAIGEMNKWIVPVSSADISHDRISMTYPLINNAKHIIFHIQGQEKASVVKRVLDEDSVLPAVAVQPVSGTLIFLLDKQAASALSYGENFEDLEEGILIKG